jgi:hypothetical protein
MEGLGSDLDSLLRYPSGPRPLVLDILKGKGSLIEVVRCSENGLILLKEVEHTPDHKANVTQERGGMGRAHRPWGPPLV